MEELITRQEYWRRCYHARRYLECCSENEIAQRMRDVLTNLTWLTGEGKIGLIPPLSADINWLEKYGHIAEECKLRGIRPPRGVAISGSLPKPTFPSTPWAANLMGRIRERVGNGPYLAKLGKARYLDETYRTGAWRISLASTYRDPSLNPAQQDSELEVSLHRLPSEVTISIPDHKTGNPKASTHPMGKLTIISTCSTDFYVSCLCEQVHLRLFDDFEADSCLIVYDPSEFERRMFKAAVQVLPNWAGSRERVQYIDPYTSNNPNPDIPASKHFRYWYQREVRFVWLPETARGLSEHLFLELGDISGIAQLEHL
jgi:hypothetical protein